MRYAFIHEQRDQDNNAWPVSAMCAALRVSGNGFYNYVRRLGKPGAQAERRAELAEKIERVHEGSRSTYGSPRVHRQLRDDGEVVSEKTVAKVMKSLEIQGKSRRPRKPRTTDSAHGKPVAENVLERDFTATGPNRKWVSDITYTDTDEGWLYLSDKADRAQEGWLDGVIPLVEYRNIRNQITLERREIGEKLQELEHHAGNRFEPMPRFLKASKQAEKLASRGTPEEQLDFFRKVGSNPQLVSRHLTCELRGAWQHVEKSTLLVPAPGSDMSEPGTKPENTFAFSERGEGGIRRPRFDVTS